MPAARAEGTRLRRRPAAIAFGIGIGIVSLQALAQDPGIFKWTDAQGRTHFDDRNLREQRLTLDYINARRIPGHEEATTPREFIEAVRSTCNADRDRLASLSTARRIEGRDPSGITYVLSPRQAQVEMAISERNVGLYCADGAAERLYRASLPSDQDRVRTVVPVQKR